MHRLPLASEIRFLVGAELSQIIIDPYEVRFLLVSNRCQIELRSSYAFAYCHDDIEDVFEFSVGQWKQAPVRFHALLDLSVSDLTVSAEGDEMTLTFEAGKRLIIRSEVGGMYESGLISGTVDGVGWLWVF